MTGLLRYWPPLLHLALLTVLLPLAAWQWLMVPDAVPTPIDAPSTAVTASPGSSTLRPVDEAAASHDRAEDLTEITNRPIFRQGRRQVVPEPAAEPEPEPLSESAAEPSEPLRMVGYVDSGSEPVAIILVPDEGVEYVVHKGDEIAGMVVITIEPNKVVLNNTLQEVTISMYRE